MSEEKKTVEEKNKNDVPATEEKTQVKKAAVKKAKVTTKEADSKEPVAEKEVVKVKKTAVKKIKDTEIETATVEKPVKEKTDKKEKKAETKIEETVVTTEEVEIPVEVENSKEAVEEVVAVEKPEELVVEQPVIETPVDTKEVTAVEEVKVATEEPQAEKTTETAETKVEREKSVVTSESKPFIRDGGQNNRSRYPRTDGKTDSQGRRSRDKDNRRRNTNDRDKEKEFEERVVIINRVTKVVKGGRRFRFSALVVVGDKKGRVGMGTGKANEVPDAIKKAVENAKKNVFNVPIVGTTLPHAINGKYGAGQVFLKPASEGTGVIAGGPVRSVLELAGVQDVLSKCIGSKTPINVVRATVQGLKSLQTLEMVAQLRGLKPEEVRK